MSAIRDITEAARNGRIDKARTPPPGGVAAYEKTRTGDFRLSVGQFPEPIPDELQLISLSQHGDNEAFARLYERYVDQIYRYVFFRVGDERFAEDITAHVFIKMWEKLPAYQIGKAPIGAWLYRIAHNAVIDHYRTRRTFVSLDDVSSREVRHDDGIDEKLDQQIRLDQLGKALQKLTDEQREVLTLKFIEGFGTQEIAWKLGKTLGAVRALQMRGLQGLARSSEFQTES